MVFDIKNLLCILCGLMVLFMAAMGLAAATPAETTTLSALKKTVPERLRLTVTTQDGQTVTVDAPITLPEGDTLPIQLVKETEIPLEQTQALRDMYTMTDSSKRYWKMNNGETFMSYEFAPKGKSRLRSPLSGGMRLAIRGGQPDQNDTPVERPGEKLQELLDICQISAVIRPVWQAAYSKAYRTTEGDVEVSSRGDAYMKITVHEDQPIKGFEVGSYSLVANQWLDGVEIFECHNSLSMVSEEDFNVFLSPLETVEVRLSDAPLAPFSVIQKAIEQRIAAGDITAVYTLSLGYAQRYVGNNPDMKHTDIRQLLVPVWKVQGYDMKFIAGRADQDYTLPTGQECWEAGLLPHLL